MGSAQKRSWHGTAACLPIHHLLLAVHPEPYVSGAGGAEERDETVDEENMDFDANIGDVESLINIIIYRIWYIMSTLHSHWPLRAMFTA